MSKANVLSVDDDKNLQVVVQHYLEGEGYSVTQALNGKETEAHLAESNFDIVLLDLVLRDTEGLSLITKIRMSSKVPVITIRMESPA